MTKQVSNIEGGAVPGDNRFVDMEGVDVAAVAEQRDSLVGADLSRADREVAECRPASLEGEADVEKRLGGGAPPGQRDDRRRNELADPDPNELIGRVIADRTMQLPSPAKAGSSVAAGSQASMLLDRIVRWRELSKCIPYSAMHIRRLEQTGQFPKRIKLGVGKRAAVGWSYCEVVQWMERRMAAREGASAQLEPPFNGESFGDLS